jgi:hypothetical protein
MGGFWFLVIGGAVGESEPIPILDFAHLYLLVLLPSVFLVALQTAALLIRWHILPTQFPEEIKIVSVDFGERLQISKPFKFRGDLLFVLNHTKGL